MSSSSSQHMNDKSSLDDNCCKCGCGLELCKNCGIDHASGGDICKMCAREGPDRYVTITADAAITKLMTIWLLNRGDAPTNK